MGKYTTVRAAFDGGTRATNKMHKGLQLHSCTAAQLHRSPTEQHGEMEILRQILNRFDAKELKCRCLSLLHLLSPLCVLSVVTRCRHKSRHICQGALSARGTSGDLHVVWYGKVCFCSKLLVDRRDRTERCVSPCAIFLSFVFVFVYFASCSCNPLLNIGLGVGHGSLASAACTA